MLPKDERNEQVYALRMTGATYREIASRFDIAVQRAREICLRQKKLEDNRGQWPLPMMTISVRLQNALVRAYNDNDILLHPERLKNIPLSRLRWYPGVGMKSVRLIVELMVELGYVKPEDEWLQL